jgi:hypothetical protein
MECVNVHVHTHDPYNILTMIDIGLLYENQINFWYYLSQTSSKKSQYQYQIGYVQMNIPRNKGILAFGGGLYQVQCMTTMDLAQQMCT